MYKTKIKIISDACCKIPNAHIKGRASFGPAACGFIILDENDQILAKGSQYLGAMTVPQAELKGLICALEEGAGHGRNDVDIWMDSELVVRWMNGSYRMKKPEIRELYDIVKQKEQRFVGKIQYFWHKRNAKWAIEADKLANAEFIKNHS